MPKIRMISRQLLDESSRIIEKLGTKYVLKHGCPDSSRTGGQNRIEGQTWDRVKDVPDATEYLVPVLDYDPAGTWLLMPLVHTITEKVSTPHEPQIKLWIQDQHMRGGDVHSYNMGKIGQRVVLLDYGFSYEYDAEDMRGSCGRCSFCQTWDGSF